MSLVSIRRRVGKLQTVIVVDPLPGHPPLTADEIEALARRMADGQTWTEEEMARVIRQCPISQGQLMITAYGGQVTIKRYVGVDPAWI
ncbi:MAG: hypothetical protein ABSH44_22895 [Bryobacteraceae bacterium]|jgi:hypothetical protein